MKNFMDVSGNFKVRNSSAVTNSTTSIDMDGALTWSQIGADIDGEAAGDRSGFSVSLNDEGTIVAIGAYQNDGGTTNGGHVRVYQSDGSSWTQLGGDIDSSEGGAFGWSVSLNSDGTILSVGAPTYNNKQGYVKNFQYNGTSWNQLGSTIFGPVGDVVWGIFTRLNSDGTIMVGGGDRYNSKRGLVRVYQWNGSSWAQLGSDLVGGSGARLGRHVSINSDGTIIAAGAAEDAGGQGAVRVYQWNGSSWAQLGSTVTGGSGNYYFSSHVTLSNDGTMFCIGSTYGAGKARVYQWNGSAWTQVGYDIIGEADGDRAGYAVTMNGDGTIIAIGGPSNDGSGENAGHARIYQWRIYTQSDEDNSSYHYQSTVQNSTTQTKPLIITANTSTAPVVGQYYWKQIGTDIDGEAASDGSTEYNGGVALNNNGNVIAIGAWLNDGNGVESGHTRVYQIDGSISTATTTTSITVLDVSGGTVNMLSSTVDVSSGIVDISGTTWMNRGQSGGTIADAYQKGLVIESNSSSASDAVLYIETAGQTQAFSVRADGSVYADNALSYSSDDRRKINEQHITNATETLKKLSPQIYTKLNAFVANGGTPTKTESGLIAQEIYYNAPELRHLVYTEGNPQPYDLSGTTIENDPDYTALGWGDKTAYVNYIGLIPYIIKSNQEQQEIMDNKKQQLVDNKKALEEDIESRIAALET